MKTLMIKSTFPNSWSTPYILAGEHPTDSFRGQIPWMVIPLWCGELALC